MQTATDDKVSQAEAEAFAKAQAIMAAGGSQNDAMAAVEAIAANPGKADKPIVKEQDAVT